jgi:hypothetical protein
MKRPNFNPYIVMVFIVTSIIATVSLLTAIFNWMRYVWLIVAIVAMGIMVVSVFTSPNVDKD